MSSVVISGDTSGAITVSAPLVAGTNTLTLQAATATSAVNTLGTSVASTSGTSIDFTGLPSWVKRVIVMFSGVSGSGTSHLLIQLLIFLIMQQKLHQQKKALNFKHHGIYINLP
jgi:hypothetical protein